jgi:monofunctional glycosyltransferase
MNTFTKQLLRLLGLITLSFIVLQLFFLIKIAFMHVISPQSTSFQRSEAWRIVVKQGELPWRQEWVSYDSIATSIKQAVIASEDGVGCH